VTDFNGSNNLTNKVKALKEKGSKDQASIPSGPSHHARNNTTMQYETKSHKIHR